MYQTNQKIKNQPKEEQEKSAKNSVSSAAKPVYTSRFEDELDGILKDLEKNRSFSYDPATDALYDQYKDSYTRLGELAMRDTVGQASSLTGGYTNSYAQTAGQAAYNDYMSRLSDILPTLSDKAYERNRAQYDALMDSYALISSRESMDYDRYRDALADYLDAQQRDYEKQQDAIKNQQWDDSFTHDKEQDAIKNQQWEDSFTHDKEQDAIKNQQWEDSFTHDKEQDDIKNQQWEDSFTHDKEQDAIKNQQWEDSFTHDKEQDAIKNQQWEDSFAHDKEQDAIKNQQWEDSFAYEKEQDSAKQENESSPVPLDPAEYRDWSNSDFERYFLGIAGLEGMDSALSLIQSMGHNNIINKGSVGYYMDLVRAVYEYI